MPYTSHLADQRLQDSILRDAALQKLPERQAQEVEEVGHRFERCASPHRALTLGGSASEGGRSSVELKVPGTLLRPQPMPAAAAATLAPPHA